MSAPPVSAPAVAVPAPAREERRHARLLAGFGVLGGTLCVLTVVLTLSGAGAPGPRDRAAFLHGVLVAVPVAVGLFAASRRRHRRFGWLLIASGLLWSLATLAESRHSLPYSAGRVAGWCVITLVIYLMLAFPDGVPRTPLDRGLARAAGALFLLLYLPTALLVERYPAQTPWSQCSVSCPPNAFQLTAREPAFADAVVRPLREGILVVLLVAVTVVLLRCAIVASPLRRRTLAPVVVGAVPTLIAFIAFTVVRQAAPGWAGVPVLAWLAGLSVCTIPLGFLAGLIRWRLYVGRVLGGVAAAVRDDPDSVDAGALGAALGDVSLEILPAEPDAPGERAVMAVADHDRAVAYVVGDPALLEDDELRDVLSVYALGWARNRRLALDLDGARRELANLRRAHAADVDRERDRIRRNLHDGAQQRLVAVQVHLGVAGDMLRRDPDAGAELLEAIGPQLEAAIDELRTLGRGEEPPLLAEHGLAAALGAVVRDAPLSTELDAMGIGRYPAEVESAVYFTCLEALQNAVRHGRATRGTVWLREDADLRFAITDDGVGFVAADRNGGAGLGNMSARIEAVGGTVVVRSTPGAGTEVRGWVPLAAGAEAAAGAPGSRITRKA